MKSSFISFNCKGIKRNRQHVHDLCQQYDIITLQELWLIPEELDFLQTIHPDFAYHGVSAVDTSAGVLVGRPYGGVAILWRKSLFTSVTPIDTGSTRVVAVRVSIAAAPPPASLRSFIIVSVYMPTQHVDNIPLFTECLAVISAVIENNSDENVICLGDFNADLTRSNSVFGRELKNYCEDQNWVCVDVLLLGLSSNTYTFQSDAHVSLTTSWIDHCIVTESARCMFTSARVLSDVYASDHFPLVLECDIDMVVPKVDDVCNVRVNRVIWGMRNSDQIRHYSELCDKYLNACTWPASPCKDDTGHCNPKQLIETMYSQITDCMARAAIHSYLGDTVMASYKKLFTLTGRFCWHMVIEDLKNLMKITSIPSKL
ncbi:endonuclease/Exonuclease/phosphatase family domain-containing protein [Phthorimaea operculella]|nr:endonuclease/Exonuclease/phosphatase family domain-containing protein [Phthorimaea operculella]